MRQQLLTLFNSIPGWLSIHEGQFLEKAVRSVGKEKGAIVEIGSYCGKSTICIAQGGELVFAIDPHEGEFSGGTSKPTLPLFLKNLSRAGVEKSVKPVVKTSAEAAKHWNKPIKFLFIDGLHDYRHAKEDYLLWSPHLVDGGIIAMHDAFCGWDGSRDVAMRHIVYNSEFGEIGVVGSIIYGRVVRPAFWGTIDRLRSELVIEFCQAVYGARWIPKMIQFLLVHRLMRIFLINRFTSFG